MDLVAGRAARLLAGTAIALMLNIQGAGAQDSGEADDGDTETQENVEVRKQGRVPFLTGSRSKKLEA